MTTINLPQPITAAGGFVASGSGAGDLIVHEFADEKDAEAVAASDNDDKSSFLQAEVDGTLVIVGTDNNEDQFEQAIGALFG